MSKSPADVRIPLTVLADSPATEIFVIDHSLQKRAGGLGTLEVELPQGYYKIRFRAAGAYQERLVELSEATGPQTVTGKMVNFSSSVPIVDTATSEASHAYRAEALSHSVHRHLGSGSSLFVFARDVNPADPVDTWRGVSVHDIDGALLAELSDGDCDDVYALAGLGLELNPGPYRLRVDTERFGVYEMFVVTCPGWQTQVFGLVEDFVARGDQVRRMALRSVSVLMARMGEGFRHHSAALRLADMARLGLRDGRSVVSSDVMRQLLDGKVDNPMLGIYGSHLLLIQGKKTDHALVDAVVDNLSNLLGPHPDLLALQLWPGAGTPPKDLAFPTPPMLRSSWDLILRGTARRNSLVPLGSWSDLLSDGILTSAPWLLRRVSEAATASRVENISFSATKRLLVDFTTALRSPDFAREVRSSGKAAEAEFSPLERVILAASRSVATAEEVPTTGEVDAIVEASTVLERIDAPPAAIARSTVSALRKLEEHGLDVRRLGIAADLKGFSLGG